MTKTIYLYDASDPDGPRLQKSNTPDLPDWIIMSGPRIHGKKFNTNQGYTRFDMPLTLSIVELSDYDNWEVYCHPGVCVDGVNKIFLKRVGTPDVCEAVYDRAGSVCIPKICEEDEVRGGKTCWDESVVNRDVCRSNVWVPRTDEACPRPVCKFRNVRHAIINNALHIYATEVNTSNAPNPICRASLTDDATGEVLVKSIDIVMFGGKTSGFLLIIPVPDEELRATLHGCIDATHYGGPYLFDAPFVFTEAELASYKERKARGAELSVDVAIEPEETVNRYVVTGHWNFNGLLPRHAIICYRNLPSRWCVYQKYQIDDTGDFSFEWTGPQYAEDKETTVDCHLYHTTQRGAKSVKKSFVVPASPRLKAEAEAARIAAEEEAIARAAAEEAARVAAEEEAIARAAAEEAARVAAEEAARVAAEEAARVAAEEEVRRAREAAEAAAAEAAAHAAAAEQARQDAERALAEEEERKAQEAMARAEEEARRAQEAMARAEEEARRAQEAAADAAAHRAAEEAARVAAEEAAAAKAAADEEVARVVTDAGKVTGPPMYIKFDVPWLDLLPGLPYISGVPILPGFRLSEEM